jgi:hypothetical protein
LRILYYSLTPDLQSDIFIPNKLVITCRNILVCQIVYLVFPDNLNALISSLKTSIIIYKFSYKNKLTLDIFIIDYRYYNNNSNCYNHDDLKKIAYKAVLTNQQNNTSYTRKKTIGQQTIPSLNKSRLRINSSLLLVTSLEIGSTNLLRKYLDNIS